MIVDLEPYLQDISPEAPCGEDLSYDSDMLELEQEFQGRPEQQIGDSVSEGVEPNWDSVKDRADTLLKRTHDLRIVLQFAVALTKVDGLPGLHAGLTLLKEMISRQWEHVHPQLDPDDDNDPLERVNILASINVPAGSLGDPIRFRYHAQHAPLTNSRGFGRVTYRDILTVRSGEAPSGGETQMSSADIEAAFMDSDVEFLAECHEAITGAKDAVRDLDATLTDHVGAGASTSFDGIMEDLRGIESELAERLRQRGYGVESAEGEGAEGEEAAGPSGGGKGGAALSGDVNSPRDAEIALDKVIRYYQMNEPSSPVPMLVEVAKGLISKSFVEISSALPPDTVELIRNIVAGGGSGGYDDYGSDD